MCLINSVVPAILAAAVDAIYLICITDAGALQVGEVGELSEIFQWKGEVPRGLPGWEARETEHLGEELADVLLYLVRLSDMCGVDLGKAALRKIGLNAIKHPVGKRHDTSSKKLARRIGGDDDKDGVAKDGGKL